MRKLLFALSCIAVCFLSCQKELSPGDYPPPAGSVAAVFTLGGSPNACTGATVAGTFATGITLTAAEKATISVNVTKAGTYSISTNTVNGYKFTGTGTFTSTGTKTVVLSASGTPLAPGSNEFTPLFGSSSCKFSVTVVAPTPAVFTLAGAPNACTGATVSGTYGLGVALDNTNKATIQVDVTSIGAYTISTNTVGGMTFAANGMFTATGIQNVTLVGSGTPTTAGVNVMMPQIGTSTCTFPVTVLGPAVYTMAGAPGACTTPTINGVYSVGTALTAANTVAVSVNVTTPGSYTLSTNTVGGVTFSKTGMFTAIGAQTVTLVGTGTPTTAGANVFTPQFSGSSCTFTVPVVGPAVYTFVGGTGACTNSTVNGTYSAGTALSASNTVTIKVNVTSIGAYTIATSAVAGMTFSKTGIFTATGPQDVILNGTGTPNSPGTASFTILNNGCSFDVTVAAPSGTYTCKIDGVFTSFGDRAKAEDLDNFFSPPTPYLYLNGYTGPATGNTVPQFQIFITKNDNTVVGPGTYNETSILSYRIEIDYHVLNPDMSTTIWNTSSNLLSPNPPFTIIVTSKTATRVKGTFSGKLTNVAQGSTQTKTITEGTFDLPIY